MRRRSSPAQGGFTLIEIAVVLVIVGLIVGMGVQFARTYTENQRFKRTEVKLDTIEEALVLYASQHRRLPCPANGTAQNGTALGDGSAECTNNQANGVVPWRTLGLAEDVAVDGWQNYITYRVDDSDGSLPDCPNDILPSPARTDGMNLSVCDPVSNTISLALDGLGLEVRDGGGEVIMDPNGDPPTGAAYVLISHGPNGFGAIGPDGTANPIGGATTAEQQNRATQALQAFYVDDELGVFDDMLRYATIMQVATRARLGPRRP